MTSSSPNTVLVVFLILFILSTLGLGTWVYMLFGQRAAWEAEKRKSKETADAATKVVELECECSECGHEGLRMVPVSAAEATLKVAG